MLGNDTDTDAALGFCWLLENILLLSTFHIYPRGVHP